MNNMSNSPDFEEGDFALRQSSPVKLSKSIMAVLSMAKEQFVAELYAFMEKIGQPITKMPSLGYQELDLHRLFHAVISRGGMDEVTRKQEWKLVYQDLEIPTMSTSASYNTRTNYKKHLYLYELEVCDWGEERPADAAPPRFQVGDFVRLESSTYEGQVFYAQISKYQYRNQTNMYYVHYNGWSTSHDEWMPENVLDELRSHERSNPAELSNPSPSRSSKSNYLIYDPLVSERHHPPKAPVAAIAPVTSTATSMSSAPKKRKRSTKDDGKKSHYRDLQSETGMTDEELLDDEYFATNVMATNMSSSTTFTGTQRQSNRRKAANGNSKTGAKASLFLEELDHPAVDSKLHGYPKRRKDSYCALDFGMGAPEQLYYFGGRWKHTTPRVRKFHIHRQAFSSRNLRLNESLLAKVLKEPKILPPHAKKLSRIVPTKQFNLPAIDTKRVDKRSTEEIELSIAEKEVKLKALKKDLKFKSKLLSKYYGRSVDSLLCAAD